MNTQKALCVEMISNNTHWEPFSVACKLCDMGRLDLCNDRTFGLGRFKWSKQATQMLKDLKLLKTTKGLWPTFKINPW